MRRPKTKVEKTFDNKNRMAEFREKMKADGYQSLTVFVSKEFNTELKRICDEGRLKRHEGMEEIFKGYLGNRYKNSTKTSQEPSNDGAVSVLTEKMDKMQAELDELKSRFKKTEIETHEVWNDVFAKDYPDDDLEFEDDPEQMPDVPDWTDKPAYKKFTADLVERYKGEGLSLRKIASRLTADGVKTRTGGDEWSYSTIQGIVKKELKDG